MVRKAMFAGSFYDGNPQSLKQQFDKWFDQATVPEIDGKTIGVICPHAGYIYSGSCAAYSYKLLAKRPFKKAVIIHPSHRGNHFGYSIAPFSEYATPLGNIKASDELNELLSSGSEQIDVWYHQNEHSMEVQLPFLAYINPEVEVLPVMLGNQSNSISIQLAEKLQQVIKQYEDTVIIVSTDLSHYLSAHEAENMDGKLIGQILENDVENFSHCITSRRTEACGFGGILCLMHLCALLQNCSFNKLHYTHSGNTSGDYSQVVGYLSAVLSFKD